MRSFPLVLALVSVLVAANFANAQKQEKKPALPPGELFFTMKGQPFALERIFPGVQGALLLSDDQKKKLFDVLEETTWSEAVRSAGKTIKSDPNATQAQKDAARKLIEEARAKLLEKAADVLTAEQRVLADRINTAATEAHQAAREKFEADFTAAKGNKEAMEEVNQKIRGEAQTDLGRKLENFLSPEQRKSLEQAAEQQKKAAEAGKKVK